VVARWCEMYPLGQVSFIGPLWDNTPYLMLLNEGAHIWNSSPMLAEYC
jgi:hypothetical protein